jgi:hypothetical protein
MMLNEECKAEHGNSGSQAVDVQMTSLQNDTNSTSAKRNIESVAFRTGADGARIRNLRAERS